MPFQPGNQLAKRKGKHRKTIEKEKALEYISKRVAKELKPIMDKAIEQAKSGDQATRKDLFDRAYGKPTETIKHEGLEFLFEDGEKTDKLE